MPSYDSSDRMIQALHGGEWIDLPRAERAYTDGAYVLIRFSEVLNEWGVPAACVRVDRLSGEIAAGRARYKPEPKQAAPDRAPQKGRRTLRPVPPAKDGADARFRHFRAYCTAWEQHTGEDATDFGHRIVTEVTEGRTQSSGQLRKEGDVDALSVCTDYARQDLAEAGYDVDAHDAAYAARAAQRLTAFGPDGAGGYNLAA